MSKKTIGDIINSKKNVSSKSSDKEFNIDELDEFLGNKGSNFKPQKFIKFNEVFERELNHPEGLIAVGHTSIISGHSNSGKGAVIIEVAKASQKMGALCIFLITELKWSMERLHQSGFEMTVKEIIDEDSGEIILDYSGDFIYRDAESLTSIDKVGEFMDKCLTAQRNGKLNRDIVFLLDSAGVVKSEKALDSEKGSSLFDASCMANWFQRIICPQINLTRKSSSKYNATFVVSNHVWVNSMEFGKAPIQMLSGGNALYKMASCLIQMGDTTRAGTSIISAQREGKKVEFGLRTKISLVKWHNDGGANVKSKIIIVKDGFIEDSPQAIKTYSKINSKTWIKKLGISEEDSEDFNIIDEDDE